MMLINDELAYQINLILLKTKSKIWITYKGSEWGKFKNSKITF